MHFHLYLPIAATCEKHTNQLSRLISRTWPPVIPDFHMVICIPYSSTKPLRHKMPARCHITIEPPDKTWPSPWRCRKIRRFSVRQCREHAGSERHCVPFPFEGQRRHNGRFHLYTCFPAICKGQDITWYPCHIIITRFSFFYRLYPGHLPPAPAEKNRNRSAES